MSTNSPGLPSPRVYHSLLAEPGAGRAILFGGQATYRWDMDLQDVWAFDLVTATWEFIGALDAGDVYAIAQHKELGWAIALNLRGETWAYSVSSREWEQRDPPRVPAARYGHRMVYEAHTGRIVLFGGFEGERLDAPLFDDTWIYEYETDTWTLMEPERRPPARIYHSMVYHPIAKRTLVWGGRPVAERDDVTMWAYDSLSNTWEPMPRTACPDRRLVYAPMVYCPEIDRVVMFGGLELAGQFEGRLVDDTWLYDFEGNRWTRVPATEGPSARSQHAMVYCPAIGKVLLFGGEVGGAYSGEFTRDLWLYDPVSNRWEQIVAERGHGAGAWPG